MNDISLVRAQMPVAANVGKPMPTADYQAQGVKEAGNSLPPATDTKSAVAADNAANVHASEQKAKEKADADQLKVAVKTANDFVQTVQRDLHFSIDDETDRTVVKVVESSSGEVIRQVPDETFLELARKMKEQGQVNLVDATG